MHFFDVANERFNPSQPNNSMHIFHTALYTFPKMLTRRICLKVKSLFGW